MQPDVISGRYRVIKAIGRGGMGTVWLCRDEVLRRDVAVKQMGALPGEDSESTTRAMREARVSAAMNHENAIAVYDVRDHDQGTWLVMEYFPSQTLADLIKAEGALPVQRVARIGQQAAAALASAHGLGIVHRDIKPGNILVGRDDVAKISDFGIARGHTDLSLTQTGMMTGTPGYFAPEVARGGDPSFASDCWALGATLFTAVEGQPPYPTQTNPLAVLSAITREPPPRPERAGPLGPVISSLMQRDASQRWSMDRTQAALAEVADGGEVDGDTRAFAVDTGPESTTSSATTVAEPVASAGPAAAAGGVETSGTAETSGADDGWTSQWAIGTAGEPPAPREGRWAGWWVAAVVALIVLGIGAAAWAAFSPDDGTTPQAGSSTPKKTGQSPGTKQPTTAPTTSTEPTQTTPETTAQTTATTTNDPGGPASRARAAAFVTSYFTVVPGDLDAGWAQLSPAFQQATGRDSYDSFWSGYQSVEVTNVWPASPTLVNYTISYDGSTPENKQITLVRDGSSYLIDSDGVQ